MEHAGWHKYEGNPVLGGALGTCFDVSVHRYRGGYRMWFSWRPRRSIALTESPDGVTWSAPVIVLGPADTDWEDDLNRPVVIRHQGAWHMWYTGQAGGCSAIGYAVSADGVLWQRQSAAPVLTAEQPWEKGAVMCPHVLSDRARDRYRMWYSAGDQYEPNAIGYAESADGRHWARHAGNPVLTPEPAHRFEQHKVTACQVVRHRGWHVMFYLGFEDEHTARICLARSRDGFSDWHRHPQNPILGPTPGAWDAEACYKPFALRAGDRWLLWYNGRRGSTEQIGLAVHEGLGLGF